MMGRMPSSYGRNIATAVFVLALATEPAPETATTSRSVPNTSSNPRRTPNESPEQHLTRQHDRHLSSRQYQPPRKVTGIVPDRVRLTTNARRSNARARLRHTGSVRCRIVVDQPNLFSLPWNQPSGNAFRKKALVVESPMVNFEYHSSASAARVSQSKSDDYHARAVLCIEQARSTDNATMKRVFKHTARAWLRLAKHAQKDDSR
jgi:hypothetical protein